MTSPVTSTPTARCQAPPRPGALAFGPYSYQASYSGDANYSPSATACQPFSVTSGPVEHHDRGQRRLHQLGLVEHRDQRGLGLRHVHRDRPAGDRPDGDRHLQPVPKRHLLGYPPAATSQVAVGAASLSTGALEAGLYSYEASYSGDGTYSASTGNCQAFPVASAPSAISTSVFDGTTNSA